MGTCGAYFFQKPKSLTLILFHAFESVCPTMVGPFIYNFFLGGDRFKTFISLQIPFKHLLWPDSQRASEGEHCLIITCHWLLGKLDHVQIVRLRCGKAEARSDTRKEVRRLGSREVVAFRKHWLAAREIPRFSSVT